MRRVSNIICHPILIKSLNSSFVFVLETKISYSGSYIVILKILNDDSKTNRTKRSNPDKDDKKEQNIQIINVINQNIQRNVFNIKCSECTSKQFVTYVNLAKDSYIKYNLPSLQQQNIILRYRMNQNKGFTKLYLDQDTGICLENESDKFISTWKCADGRSCLSRTGFYRASKLSLIIVNFNVFVETEDNDGYVYYVDLTNIQLSELYSLAYLLVSFSEEQSFNIHNSVDFIFLYS